MAYFEEKLLMEQVRVYLRPFSLYYPDIDNWFRKVRLEAKSGRRRILALCLGGQLIGLAITRPNEKAKLCNFSLSPSSRGLGLGLAFMKLAMRDLLLSGTRAVHVTASDEVAESYGGFFKRCGFDLSAYIRNCYRRGSDELIYTATLESLNTYLFSNVVFEEEQHDNCIWSSFGKIDLKLIPNRSEAGLIRVDVLQCDSTWSCGEYLSEARYNDIRSYID